VTDECNPEYALPGTMPPILLFSVLYGFHCIKEKRGFRKHRHNKLFVLFKGTMFLLYLVLCMFLYMTGSLFIYEWLLTTIYCFLSFYMVLKFERTINQLLKKLTIKTMQAKKYVFFIAFTALGIESLLIIIYNSSYVIPKVI